MLLVSQINLNKSQAATTHLVQSLKGKKNIITLVTEPNTLNGKVTGFPRDLACFYKSEDKRVRAAIAISRNIGGVMLDEYSSKDCVVVMFRSMGNSYLLVSFYSDINKSVDKHEITKALDFATTKNLQVILGGDTNAHSTLYGVDTNKRGKHGKT
jgi:hypothetical protein